MTCKYKVGDCVTPPNLKYTYFIIVSIDERVTVKTFFRDDVYRYNDCWSVAYINGCIRHNPKIVAKRCNIR